jgi:hypothetical protein
MENLRERERSNLAGIELQRVGSRLVGKYTGYGHGALKCSARPTRFESSPFVGTLVYGEIVYSKSGKTRVSAGIGSRRCVSENADNTLGFRRSTQQTHLVCLQGNGNSTSSEAAG